MAFSMLTNRLQHLQKKPNPFPASLSKPNKVIFFNTDNIELSSSHIYRSHLPLTALGQNLPSLAKFSAFLPAPAGLNFFHFSLLLDRVSPYKPVAPFPFSMLIFFLFNVSMIIETCFLVLF
jgi:hypothetical protein